MLTRTLAAAGPLVGATIVARMLGLNRKAVYGRRLELPQPVVVFGKTPMWRRSDIEAWGRGQREFTHKRGALEKEYVSSDELAKRLGISVALALQRVGLCRWELIPPPVGRAGSRLYWSRDGVERWFVERERQVEGSNA
jgi:predicted DNA-binding transcriptional regulator AlpA